MNEENINVHIPSRNLEGRSGWLCYVCVRGTCRDVQPWSWFGCEYCREVDHRVGALFGSRRFLPLGQHSIMNNLGLRITDATDAPLSAFADQFQAMVGGWQALADWGKAHCQEMAEALGVNLTDGQGTVALEQWQAAYPSTPEASAQAYLAHLRAQQPWLLELEPRIDDITWLTASTTE